MFEEMHDCNSYLCTYIAADLEGEGDGAASTAVPKGADGPDNDSLADINFDDGTA